LRSPGCKVPLEQFNVTNIQSDFPTQIASSVQKNVQQISQYLELQLQHQQQQQNGYFQQLLKQDQQLQQFKQQQQQQQQEDQLLCSHPKIHKHHQQELSSSPTLKQQLRQQMGQQMQQFNDSYQQKMHLLRQQQLDSCIIIPDTKQYSPLSPRKDLSIEHQKGFYSDRSGNRGGNALGVQVASIGLLVITLEANIRVEMTLDKAIRVIDLQNGVCSEFYILTSLASSSRKYRVPSRKRSLIKTYIRLFLNYFII